ncbi:SusC/RagA family TonB-linked outer membrane protein [Elizabethkingia sp. HX WHF]|nr:MULTISPECIES: SusC/RagA family TonB-linked outer membrane protein [Elizabethkingia]MCL1639726.1 SusC/RagA family TonB-linked outer membrane protein [Elizabethkingia bruuniana]MDX8565809.1 SusC/RagA family TonB-linked outer membrane protein [Elizabethkingia sp. HX WHF]
MNVKLRVLSAGVLFFFGQEAVAQKAKRDTGSVKNIEEVVVVAYGRQKKETFVGSNVTIKSEQISDRPLTNAAKALDGAGAGIQVATASGQPGSGINVRIRGTSSYSLSNNPLFVVDGAIYTGNINDIDPADITSFSVLKDAASTSLYGAAAANGVVLITTKGGKKGRGKLDFSAITGFVNRGYKDYEKIGAGDYYVTQWTALRNGYIDGTKPTPSLADANNYATKNLIPTLRTNIYNVPNDQLVINGALNPNASMLFNDFDWYKYLDRTGAINKYNLSYGGGDDKTSYYLSMGYNKEEGYIIKSSFQRYNVRADVRSQVTDWLKLSGSIAANTSDTGNANSNGDTGLANPFYIARTIGPIYSPYYYDANGKRVKDIEGNDIYDGIITRGKVSGVGRNVIQETLLNSDTSKNDAINTRLSADLRLAKGLTFTNNVSYDLRNLNRKIYRNPTIGDASGSGDLTNYSYRYETYTINQLLNYNKKFGNHTIDATIGHEAFKYTSAYNYIGRKGQIMSGILEEINFGTLANGSGYSSVLAKESIFGRFNYDYDNRYIVSGSIRQDKSSRFSPDNNKGTFWSVGLGWNISRESFMQNSVFNALKLRGSYGQVGNDGGIGNAPGYQAYMSLYDLGKNNAGLSGALIAQVGNTKLKWESNNQFDVGVDFGLFKNRISGTLEYYKRKTTDMIFAVPQPYSSGFPDNQVYYNAGDSQNQGYEITLNLGIIRSQNFNWDLNLNGSHYKNKMTRMPSGLEVITSGSYKLQEGRSLADYYLRQWYGVDPADGASLYIQDPTLQDNASTRTVNGTKVTTDYSRGLQDYSGSSIPKFFGSFNSHFDYKGFYLDVLFTYQWGGKVYDTNYATLMSPNPNGSAASVDILNAWKNPGDITDIPRLTTVNTVNATTASTRWLVSSDYINLRQATLGYSFNKDVVSTIGLSNLKFFISGENLWAKTARKGLEPAQNFGGPSTSDVNNQVQYRYTPSRIISFGVNATF